MTTYQNPPFKATELEPTVWHSLYRSGARFVLADAKSKRPIQDDWLERLPRTTPAQAASFLTRPNTVVGIVPASIGLVAADIDRPELVNLDKLTEAQRGNPPLLWLASQRGNGGGHAYYSLPSAPGNKRAIVGNWQWGSDGKTVGNDGKMHAGELRANNGFCILWDGEEAALQLLNALTSDAYISRPPLRLDLLPGLKPEHHTPSATPPTPAAWRMGTLPKNLPAPWTDDALEEFCREWPRGKTNGKFRLLFAHQTLSELDFEKKILSGVKDRSCSGIDESIACTALGIAQHEDAIDGEELARELMVTHNVLCRAVDDRGRRKDRRYYGITLEAGKDWLAEQQGNAPEIPIAVPAPAVVAANPASSSVDPEPAPTEDVTESAKPDSQAAAAPPTPPNGARAPLRQLPTMPRRPKPTPGPSWERTSPMNSAASFALTPTGEDGGNGLVATDGPTPQKRPSSPTP